MLNEAELKERIDKLKEESWVFKKLMKDLGGFDNLPKHLQEDAMKRMGVRRVEGYVSVDEVSSSKISNNSAEAKGLDLEAIATESLVPASRVLLTDAVKYLGSQHVDTRKAMDALKILSPGVQCADAAALERQRCEDISALRSRPLEGVAEAQPWPMVEGHVFDYPAAARSIMLNLAEFLDENDPIPLNLANAARKARAKVESLEAELSQTRDGLNNIITITQYRATRAEAKLRALPDSSMEDKGEGESHG